MTDKKGRVVAVVPAAGIGKRFGRAKNKSLFSLLGKPILLWVLETLQRTREIDEIIPVLKKSNIATCCELVERNRITKVCRIVAGGRERQDSVFNAIKILDGDTAVVLIHDGARPLVTPDILKRSLTELKGFDGVIAAVPVKDTIKEQKPENRNQNSEVRSQKPELGTVPDLRTLRGKVVESGLSPIIVKRTLDRSVIWSVQTPQTFHFSKIKAAYEKAYSEGFYATDDAALLERYGGRVRIMQGAYSNIKITTPDDIQIAEALLSGRWGAERRQSE